MLWAGFGYNIHTGLIPLDGDPESACGSVTSWVICGVYQAFLPTLLQPGGIFICDGAFVHTARIVRIILNEMGIEAMIWPPYSPDLNLIEHL
jgi:hypothetical protein